MSHHVDSEHCTCPICTGPADLGEGWEAGDRAPQLAPTFTDGQVINQINSGARWVGGTITYGFLQSSPSWDIGYEGDGFSAFTATQQTATRSVMTLWDDLIAPSLSEVGSSQEYANVKFANTTSYIAYAHAYYPGTYAWAGEVWLNAATYTGLYSPDPGDYYFMTILHEVGHALGLSHPGSYNGGSPTYANDAVYAQDTHQWTVMSYFSASNTGADWNGGSGWQYAQTPMVHDVLTIQAIYGADSTTRTGDTVYGFNSTAGHAVYDFSLNSSPVVTIYDAGGEDTLDLSGFGLRAIIDLTPGRYSSAGGTSSTMTYNIGIAIGTVVENAIGGSGNDVLYGNHVANRLTGGAGSDTLDGGAGGDTLIGGTGNDLYYVDSLADTVTEVVGEGTDTIIAIASGYVLAANVEIGLVGTAAGLTLNGNGGDNVLFGNSGADYLAGGDGSDSFSGGAGNDTIDGGAGTDAMAGGTGDDRYYVNDLGDAVYEYAGQGNDWILSLVDGYTLADHVENGSVATTSGLALNGNTLANRLSGNDGNDRLAGGIGNDTLLGNAGSDTLDGGTGGDRMAGGVGDDRYVVDDASDVVEELAGEGADSVDVQIGRYTLGANVEHGTVLIGGNAELRGNTLDNVLRGNNGDDVLNGGLGRDTLYGGSGNDLLVVDTTTKAASVLNASFDSVDLAEMTSQMGAPGWTSSGVAGTWDPIPSILGGVAPNENVMFMGRGAASTSQTLSETFDKDARYVFSFDHGTRNDVPGGEITATIHAGGTLVGQIVSTAPTSGWQRRTIVVDGSDYTGQDGQVVTITLSRTGDLQGQAQLNNVALAKEYAPGTGPRIISAVAVQNADFDGVDLAEMTSQMGAPGWTSSGIAGTWDPIPAILGGVAPNENVMFMGRGAASTSQVLSETFDKDARYVFSFDHGTRNDVPGGEITATIHAGGTLVGQIVSAAPTSGWQRRAIVVEGADHVGLEGQQVTITFSRTGDLQGQAQLNNVALVKEYAPGTEIRTISAIALPNADFDSVDLAEMTSQMGAPGWTSSGVAGTWDPTSAALPGIAANENVMFMGYGAASTSQVLSETFDKDARYVVSFDHGTRNDVPGGEITATIHAGGTLVGQIVSTAPTSGWQRRTIAVEGSDYTGQDGQVVTITLSRTGDLQGQAQLNNVDLVKDYGSGTGPRTISPVALQNASFDSVSLAEMTSQMGAPGWTSSGMAGTWDPTGAILPGIAPDENVMFMGRGAAGTSQVLSETFDKDARYVFSFDHGTRNDLPGGELTATIHAGGTLVGQVVSAAPTSGWQRRAIVVEGSDHVGLDGQQVTITFSRTGDLQGQAQLNNVALVKEYPFSDSGDDPGEDTSSLVGLSDSFYGEAGNDVLLAGAGGDTLDGGAGEDVLNGGAGDDLLTGGLDADRFVFEFGDGLDTITDFSLAEDLIQLGGYTATTFTDLSALFSDVSGDALITFDADNVITLAGITSGLLDEDHFAFV